MMGALLVHVLAVEDAGSDSDFLNLAADVSHRQIKGDRAIDSSICPFLMIAVAGFEGEHFH